MIGRWEEVMVSPAILAAGIATIESTEKQSLQNDEPSQSKLPRKKEIGNFHDLLNAFPMIARQMQSGLEKLFTEFTTILGKPLPLPPPPSASNIPDPQPDGPIAAATRSARSGSLTTRGAKRAAEGLPVSEGFYAEDDEDVMRASLETAVTAAIDLFQSVDKQQLSMLGATTDLTGPLVEKLIERYVSENVHPLLFTKLSALKRPENLRLEARIRQMEHIDISQLGITITGGARAKHDLLIQLGPVIEDFRRVSDAKSPGDVLDILLSIVKMVSHLSDSSRLGGNSGKEEASEKALMTVNADTLVSLLLYLVIRAQVRGLQARLVYVRNFIFIDDVESGETGYALSTFEAVLAYLITDSSSLRKASRQNKALWDAVTSGNLDDIRSIMESPSTAIEEESEDEEIPTDSKASGRASLLWNMTNGIPRRSSLAGRLPDQFSRGSNLSHVFPFQMNGVPSRELLPQKIVKKVAMDTRSQSSESEMSLHSRATSIESIGSIGSTLEGDVSAERLAQTTNSFGESILMMAVQAGQIHSLKYLLSLSEHFPLTVILEDVNNEDTTLLSAAVQLGQISIVELLLEHIATSATHEQLLQYLAEQDIWGRSMGHYLFHCPALIARIGRLIPWRQRDKNGQTPLFAMCRSYDHANYHDMVDAGLRAATQTQGDRWPLHLDDHVDGKGNTLLHIVNDPRLAMKMLQWCDIDVNAPNDRKFTALMVASKYGRYDMVRCLFADPRVDVAARELRGLTAVELAKDDDVRNKIDDLGLFSMHAGRDGRITGVVRAFFVEDGSVRLVLKSAAPTDHDSYTVTTSRRSLADFERLAQLLAHEHPASWIPSVKEVRSPFQLPSKPSRAVLRDIQIRTDWFLKNMLAHPTLATHEMLWEFFLVPELQLDVMEKRSNLKVEARIERIKEEYEPIDDLREVEQFISHARDMVRSISYATKSLTRRVNAVVTTARDVSEAAMLLNRQVADLAFLPPRYGRAQERFARAMAPMQSSPQVTLHTTLLAVQSTIHALLTSLSRPTTLISQISAARREAERNESAVGRSTRWPLGLLDDTRQRLQEGKEQRARRWRDEADYQSRELRYTQQTVASELAGWQVMHEKMGRRAIREYARGVLIDERTRLDGMLQALRRSRAPDTDRLSRPKRDTRQ